MTLRKVRALSHWSLVVAVLLCNNVAAVAQDLSNQSIASTTAPVIFNFVTIPDVGSIGSISANKETDIWATSNTSSASLHFNGNNWARVLFTSVEDITRKESVLLPLKGLRESRSPLPNKPRKFRGTIRGARRGVDMLSFLKLSEW